MQQMTLATGTIEPYRKLARRESLLSESDRVVAWVELCALIEPVYAKAGNDRRPIGLDRMLRIYFLQLLFNLLNRGVEEALNDSVAMARFVRLDLGAVAMPHETTICKFRHLLEAHDLGSRLFERAFACLEANGLRVSRGIIVNATIINAPISTKNASKSREPDMHQTRKGQQWYFGMMAHVGVDSRTKLIHSVVATAANVADGTVLLDLLHGDETAVWLIRPNGCSAR